MKKYVITIICLLAVIGYAKTLESPIRFAIIGDRTGSAQPGVYEQIVAEVERLKPDFVLTVGDAIQGYSEDSVELKKEWKEYKSIVSKLSMPIYFTPGNHDITTNPALPFYERYIGKPYYSFDIKGLHFVVLDVSRWDYSKDLFKEQLEWLITDLKKNQKALYTFVFYHKPFWLDDISNNKPDTLHNIFRNFGVDAVFNGHTHLYISGNYDGIMYTNVGSSGGAAEKGLAGLLYHFDWVTVDKNGISIAPIKMDAVLPWNEVTTQDIHSVEKFSTSGITFEKPIYINEDFSVSDTIFKVKLNNTSTELIIEDTLSWNITQGWSIEPKAYPVKIMPNESNTYDFKIKNKKQLYPVPDISISFPYR